MYCVTVTDNNGCADSTCMTVTVNTDCGDVFVPSAFSPNNDGVNDQLCVFGIQCISTFDLVVYDRWGEKVFESTDPSKCWDGTYKGQAMNPGTFVYYLQATLTNGKS